MADRWPSLRQKLYKRYIFFRSGSKEKSLDLHITKECYQFWHITFFLPKRSQYKDKFDILIMRMNDMGIINKFYQNEMDKISTIESTSKREAMPVSLAVSHLEGPLIIFAVLNIFSLMIFLIESMSVRIRFQ